MNGASEQSGAALAWRSFEDAAAMAAPVADAVQSILGSAIAARGSAVIAVPGGQTPKPIFHQLAVRDIDWPRVTLLPTDDRLVPIDDPLSGAGLIRTYFGSTGASLLTLFDDEADPRSAGDTADGKLHRLRWPLDLVWLGMGEDGHVASILPGPDFEGALNAPARRLAYGVIPDPLPAAAPVARVTLTRAALVATRRMVLTITGKTKRAVAEQAIRDGSSSALAIGRVLSSIRVPVEIYWCG